MERCSRHLNLWQKRKRLRRREVTGEKGGKKTSQPSAHSERLGQ